MYNCQSHNELHFASSVAFELALDGTDATASAQHAHSRIAWLEHRGAVLENSSSVRIFEHSHTHRRFAALSPHEAASTHSSQGTDTASHQAQTDTDATITIEHEVACFALSWCGAYIAVADAVGTLHLLKVTGEALFAYPVVASESDDRYDQVTWQLGSADSSDANTTDPRACSTDVGSIVSLGFAAVGSASSTLQDLVVVSSSGAVLHLGDLDLPMIERVALQTERANALYAIRQHIRVQRVVIGSLRADRDSIALVRRARKQSTPGGDVRRTDVTNCGQWMLQVLRLQSSLYVVVANHTEALSVWRARDQSATGIEVRRASEWTNLQLLAHLLIIAACASVL